MPRVYRLWISPYGDGDFDWDRAKSLTTFDDRDLVFEAARIVFRGTLLRRQDTRRRRGSEPRFMVLGELHGRACHHDHLHAEGWDVPDHLVAAGELSRNRGLP
jgi:hypothetical protein